MDDEEKVADVEPEATATDGESNSAPEASEAGISESTKEDTAAKPTSRSPDPEKLKLLQNIEVKMTVEVGRTEISIRDLLLLNEGSVVELDRMAGDPLDIFVNGTIIAKGEIVMVGEKFGIRFTDVSDPEAIVKSL
tara:strand:+ start:71 stop:478 length:408 start_codon:yes stop_codon:yes gene_type:complete